ncbi:MAG: tRNA(Ile)-lysidine synthase [Alteromonas naphthalenivorans]|jgi:tRNA(Ile)-lysidine synthase
MTHLSKKPTIIIGLSGGPDSVYLLHKLISQKCSEPNFTLIAAHLDHEWRKDSHKDVEFCEQLCKKLNVTFVSKKASELSINIKYNGSQEEVGRKLRRYFFEQLAQEYNANEIVLGHHADDQLETFFIRLFRGTTTHGLACMKQRDGLYSRPLLNISKQKILDWLKENNKDYLEDPTNNSDKYLRNKIRNSVLPALKACDNRFEQNTIRAIKHIQNTERFLQEHTKKTYEQLLDEKKELNLKQFFTLDPYLQKRILQHWLVQNKATHILSDALLKEILRFLESPRGGSHQISTQWKIIKKQSKAQIVS